jgi:hypothetical protein
VRIGGMVITAKTYPRIGDKWGIRPQGRCLVCNAPRANVCISIETDMFRGNDVVIKLHQNCLRQLSDSDILDLARKYSVI